MRRSVVTFSDWRMRDILKHPALQGSNGKRLRRLGRGAFAIVYESEQPGRVLKVTLDKFSYWVLRDPVIGVRSKYMPRVYRDYGVIGSYRGLDVYLLEMERLKPLGNRRADVPERLCQRLREFSYNFGLDCAIDLHHANIMVRPSTGEVVASDPVADVGTLGRARSRSHWEKIA